MRGSWSWTCAALAALFLVVFAPAAGATVVTFASDLLAEGNNLTPGNVFIVPHSVWAIPPPGAGWVSYANTGMGAGSFSPPNVPIPGPPNALFRETVFLPYGGNTGTGTFFADDTASVTLVNARYPGGLLLKAANPVQDSYCAAGPIACEATEGWTGDLTPFLVQGQNQFLIGAYQRDGGPFGVMYYGSIESVPEPESVAMVIIGLGLVGLGVFQKLKLRRQ